MPTTQEILANLPSDDERALYLEAQVDPEVQRLTETLYSELKASGAQIGNDNSDLYVKDTPEVREIMKRYPGQAKLATRFIPQTEAKLGQWIEIPFAFEPFYSRPKAVEG